MWSRSHSFLAATLVFAVMIVSLRCFLHSLSVQNRSSYPARVLCGRDDFVVRPHSSHDTSYSLLGTAMDCDVSIEGRVFHCSANLPPLSIGFVEIKPSGEVACQAGD